MTCGYWDVVLILYFALKYVGANILTVEDVLPQPQDFKLSWNLCSVTAQWSKPTSLDANCSVMYELALYGQTCHPNMTMNADHKYKRQQQDLKYMWNVTDFKEVCVTITTIPDGQETCGGKKQSEVLYESISRNQDEVTDFSCFYHTETEMDCTWNVLSNVSDLQLFYRDPENNQKTCVSYTDPGPLKKGCHLNGEKFLYYNNLCFTVNGTRNGLPFQNYFYKATWQPIKVKPPTLNITSDGKEICFEASKPNFLPHCWEYIFQYNKCNEGLKNISSKNHSKCEAYDVACKYTVQVRTYTVNCGVGGSDLSDPVYYGEDRDLGFPFKVAIIVTPLILACCVILALVLFRRHRNVILPWIPKPPKELFNNNKYGGMTTGLNVGNLFVPYEEVVEKPIVLEPDTPFLNPDVKIHC